jgi:purine-binding chemotaxis protein CheW
LLFHVGGLTVAVPVVDLNGVLRYPPQLVAVPGLPRWSQGVVRHRDTNMVVVDSIALFVPERLQESARARSVPRYLVLLGAGRFGLACDALDHVIRLTPAEVHWRGERGRRPWLAGTVRERLCALLEVPALVRLLTAGYLEEPDN